MDFSISSQMAEVYTQRRKALMSEVSDGIILFPSAQMPTRNYGAFPADFRQSSHILYFSGLTLPETAIALDVDNDKFIVFTHEMQAAELVWHDASPSLHKIQQLTGANEVYDFPQWSKFVAEAIKAGRKIHVTKTGAVANVEQSLSLVRAITKQRLVKNVAEIDAMRRAAKITAHAHKLAMAVTRPGITENAIQAIVEATFRLSGARPSYSPIATVRGEVLHACLPHRQLECNQLFLLDAGAETSDGYATDVTRTWPVSGQFSQTQARLYQTVLNAQEAAIQQCRSNLCYSEVHKTASIELIRGLKEFGLLNGNEDDIYAADAHAVFFPHGVGHLIGLDVHDLEDLGEDNVGYSEASERETDKLGRRYLRLKRTLEPGLVVTVEPGLYFIPGYINDPKIRAEFSEFINFELAESLLDFGGIRIEDDILITHGEPENLTVEIPKTIEAVENLVGEQAALTEKFVAAAI